MFSATTAPATPAVDEPRVVEKRFTLRCFSYRDKSGLFVAECIDLDLVVKAKKQNISMRELRDAVLGYVKVAVESGTDSELIPRRSPLSHRLHYYAVMCACSLSLLGCERLFRCTPSARTRCLV
jgi:hypothetical protein